MNKKSQLLWLLVAITLLSCFGVMNALAWSVPDTGQTKCYDSAGNIIPCPAEGVAFYGQDASYTINPMSYTKLAEDGTDLSPGAAAWAMVRDNVTGLIWENKTDDGTIHDKDNAYTWYDSSPETNGGNAGTPGIGTDTEDFINTLNAAKYGGHSDWRLPTLKELTSIVNYSILNPGPAINVDYFPNTVGDYGAYYWSSTTCANNTGNAWVIDFGDPFDYSRPKSNSYRVRAVRGGQAVPSAHLFINEDGTVTDAATGLMWQQDTPDNTMTWEQALSFCENLIFAVHADWRLPNARELKSIISYSRFEPAIDPIYFPDTNSSYYWSSTTYADVPGFAWITDFADANDDGNWKVDSSRGYVRAVRGGQSGSLDHPVILSPKQASFWNIGSSVPIRWNTDGLGTNVKISISRQGGKASTFESIIASTQNDGQYDWTIIGAESVNCVIKIEQLDSPYNWATEGLFVIKKAPVVNPGIFLLLLE